MTRQIVSIAVLGLVLQSETFGQSSRDGGDDRMSRWFSYMDRNKDGRLDGDELRRLPGQMRDSLQKSRVDLTRGLSRDDFMRVIPRAYEEMRRQQEDQRRRYEEDRRRREEEERARRDGGSSSSKKPWCASHCWPKAALNKTWTLHSQQAKNNCKASSLGSLCLPRLPEPATI